MTAFGHARRRGRRVSSVLYGVLLAALPLAVAHGQYFGRNKVLWERFEFEVVETEHFLIYYYPPGAPVAADVARLAERWYARLSLLLGHELKEKNPLIIYQDHADFQQTLTTTGLIGEGIGGFTESVAESRRPAAHRNQRRQRSRARPRARACLPICDTGRPARVARRCAAATIAAVAVRRPRGIFVARTRGSADGHVDARRRAARRAAGGFLPIQVYYAVPFQRPREDATLGLMISTGW
jgi:hypothetical protein